MPHITSGFGFGFARDRQTGSAPNARINPESPNLSEIYQFHLEALIPNVIMSLQVLIPL